MTIKERRPISKVSPKQRKEYALRARVKAKLLLECETDARGFPLCPQCGQLPDMKDGRGELHLCHEVALSQGGHTSYRNCYLACRTCHNSDHHIYEINDGVILPKTKPVDKSDSINILLGHYPKGCRPVSVADQVSKK